MKENKRYYLYFAVIIFILLLLTACSSSQQSNNDDEQVELTISAAASMMDVLEEIRVDFEEEHNDINLLYNFGSSGSLQQQIAHGAPVDLFISANLQRFNSLLDQGFISSNYHKEMVGNELVLIQPNSGDVRLSSFSDLLNEEVKKVAIGIPETVPAGYYAKEYLEKQKLYNKLKDKFIPGKDVRQVLNYVETGNTDAGIVYRTDALHSKSVQVVTTANKQDHTPIIYPVGILEDSNHKEAAMLFFDYVTNSDSLEIFKEYGFSPISDN
ncbi:molybdate ABC transporter substrate-binding protein [Aquibacillus saliphilus]|uniref:molybdate ABC transporter substrate-binding protein n=1 Tax=Aquibacillus saliphilus TaxID=1909422 RepID=UPI001CEFEF64|nr:molybdate ABC transporter substrate-binding protein [Aquibacillus saliphilus]